MFITLCVSPLLQEGGTLSTLYTFITSCVSPSDMTEGMLCILIMFLVLGRQKSHQQLEK